MSTTSTGETTADRQRLRAARGTGGKSPGTASRLPSPPRQRRPALAAIAVLLIVGGALVAGLLAIRMDSRVPMLAAKVDIEPGAVIEADDLTVVQVATDDSDKLIPAEFEDQIVGAFARARIYKNQILDQRLLTETDPIGQDRAVVSIVLSPALAPDNLREGDLVEIVRAAGTSGGGAAAERLTRGLVTSINEPDEEDLGGGAAASANILVPSAVAADVIDASSANVAGIALISRGNTIDDVTLTGF
jgi:SAF domain-containing protein